MPSCLFIRYHRTPTSSCPDAIKRLVERFDHQLDQLKHPEYTETKLRIDFVNPLFRELGWDIDNAQGFAEQYREVVHEDKVKVGGATKAMVGLTGPAARKSLRCDDPLRVSPARAGRRRIRLFKH